jgi:hypothetical protein
MKSPLHSLTFVTLAVVVLAACVAPGVDGGSRRVVSTIAPALTAMTQTLTPPALPSAVLSPNKTPTSDSASLAPEANHLYLATLSGEHVLFVTNGNFQRSFAATGAAIFDPDLGLMVNEDGEGHSPSRFHLLEQPRPVYGAERDVTSIDFKIDPTGRLLYVSLWYPGRGNARAFLNQVVAINLDDLSNRLLWTHEDRDPRYPGFAGGARIDEVVGHIAVLRLFNCYACEPSPPHAIVILNATTGSELYLGVVGDVQIDVQSNMVAFRELIERRVACEPSPGCGNDGLRLVYEPVGEMVKAQLP